MMDMNKVEKLEHEQAEMRSEPIEQARISGWKWQISKRRTQDFPRKETQPIRSVFWEPEVGTGLEQGRFSVHSEKKEAGIQQ